MATQDWCGAPHVHGLTDVGAVRQVHGPWWTGYITPKGYMISAVHARSNGANAIECSSPAAAQHRRRARHGRRRGEHGGKCRYGISVHPDRFQTHRRIAQDLTDSTEYKTMAGYALERRPAVAPWLAYLDLADTMFQCANR